MKEPMVKVVDGTLRGAVLKLLDGKPYYSFKGIPYAEPPVGQLRFREPQPLKPWTGIRDAIKHGSECPQIQFLTREYIEGNEDCLFLNVYTKSLDSKIPVMVFIHGGGFMSGSGDSDQYGPEFLLQHDVILVTINYRLEAFGFLCLDIPEVPGNAGMKDQVAALRWVKKNIAQFGGDPDNITIFGESAGAASVINHLHSPLSRGLFHKAIAQSGVSICDWSQGKEARERAFRAGRYLGKDTTDPYELLEFLRSLPAQKLIRINIKTLTKDEKHRGLPIHFAPVVEKKFEGVNGFLTEEPIDTLLTKQMTNLPLMIGYNDAEAIIMIFDLIKKIDFVNKNPNYLVPREIARKVSEQKEKEIGERIIRFYAGKAELTQEDGEKIVDMQTDLHFAYNTHRFVHFYNAMNQPIYMYRFGYVTALNIIKNMSNCEHYKGASHAEDLFYIFCNGMTKDVYEEQKDLEKCIFKITKLWTDFAKFGNPTPDGSDPKWLPYSSAKKEFYNIANNTYSGEYADKERIEFWNKLYCEAGLPFITKTNL